MEMARNEVRISKNTPSGNKSRLIVENCDGYIMVDVSEIYFVPTIVIEEDVPFIAIEMGTKGLLKIQVLGSVEIVSEIHIRSVNPVSLILENEGPLTIGALCGKFTKIKSNEPSLTIKRLDATIDCYQLVTKYFDKCIDVNLKAKDTPFLFIESLPKESLKISSKLKKFAAITAGPFEVIVPSKEKVRVVSSAHYVKAMRNYGEYKEPMELILKTKMEEVSNKIFLVDAAKLKKNEFAEIGDNYHAINNQRRILSNFLLIKEEELLLPGITFGFMINKVSIDLIDDPDHHLDLQSNTNSKDPDVPASVNVFDESSVVWSDEEKPNEQNEQDDESYNEEDYENDDDYDESYDEEDHEDDDDYDEGYDEDNEVEEN
jgi:hypothetical protein